jgi:CRISPR-associated protein Cmr5
MIRTLDQQRAEFAWKCATSAISKYGKEYKVLAKGASALIINSGLMPTLAYYNHKGGAAKQLLTDLIQGLSQRPINAKPLFLNESTQSFEEFMPALQRESAQIYLHYTDEALELLKWIRQFVDAVES